MNRSARFFRVVWRINALLILVAAAAAACGVIVFVGSEAVSSVQQRSAEAVVAPVPGKSPDPALQLGSFGAISGTSLYRALLAAPGRGSVSRSDPGSDVHNVLVFDGEAGTARWLLPGDKELIVYNRDVDPPSTKEGPRPPVATIVLVKPVSSNPEAAEGTILASDLAATDVREVAAGVRAIHGASLTTAGQLSIIFEQKGQYHLALLDATTRKVVSDRVIVVPPLE